MMEQRRRAVVKPWNILVIMGMVVAAVLFGRLSDRLPVLQRDVVPHALLGVTTVGAALFIRELLLRLRMGRWPQTQGAVTRSEVARIDDGESIIYKPAVLFTYLVDGREYASGSIRPGFEHRSSSFEGTWNRLIEKYPLGAPVTVIYNPAKPDEAFLGKGSLIPALLALILSVIAAAAAVSTGL